MLLCGWNFDGSESTLDDFVKRYVWCMVIDLVVLEWSLDLRLCIIDWR